MQACVHHDGELSDQFQVTKGVKQGYDPAFIWFYIMFSAMLTDAFLDGDVRIYYRSGINQKLFNLRRLYTKTKVIIDTLLHG